MSTNTSKRKPALSQPDSTLSKKSRVPPIPRPIKAVDDTDGYLVVKNGGFISERYRVLGYVGKGTFARVYHCMDTVEQKSVAVKVVRAIPKYREAAIAEIDTLQLVKGGDPHGSSHCLHLLSTFDFANHVCMTFDKFGASLFDFLRDNRFRGFAVSHVKSFTRQLLEATKYLHDMHIIHTDIKIENIMLVNASFSLLPVDARDSLRIPNYLDIKLIDFGSAIQTPFTHRNLVSTRHYRAPEIILGENYSFEIDLWSIGCIMYELYTGRLLFDTHQDGEHLKLIECTLGAFPSSIRRVAPHFNETDGGLAGWNAQTASAESKDRVAKCRPIEAAFVGEDPALVDLCLRLLTIDPRLRITAADALNHPWFTGAAATTGDDNSSSTASSSSSASSSSTSTSSSSPSSSISSTIDLTEAEASDASPSL